MSDRKNHPAGRPNPVSLLARDTVFQGHYRVDRYRLRHQQYDGGDGPPISREVFERGHGVVVLPYDPVRDRVVLIEQFRIAPYAVGDPPWMIEAIAGLIDDGEAPEDVARREAREEAGLSLDRLVRIMRVYVSPGGTTETLTLFAAPIDLPDGTGGVHGLAAEGEDIRVLLLDADAALAMIEDGRITAAPAVLALQWLALNRAEFGHKAG